MNNPQRKLTELMDLRGRVAVITGGAGHIGMAVGGALAELGAAVVVLDLAADQCDKAAAELSRQFGGETMGLPVDLSVEREVRNVPERVTKRFGRLDILVNCAALVGTSGLKGWAVPFLEQNADIWRLALEVNLTAPFILTQVCTPELRQSGHGSIINVSSIYGIVGPDWSLYAGTELGNPAAYAASKGGLGQLTRWLATTLAPAIRINCIIPGGVWRNQDATFHERYIRKVPLGRMASEEDFKGAAGYLASDLSAYVTGQTLVVDGGFSIW
jgi:NAD(P)-dependent dehydrogenase (short-subunit alcohol dehydrogenase family)